METVTNAVPSLLTTTGADGILQNANAAAVEAAGYDDKEDVIGSYYWDVFIAPAERDDVVERFEALAPDFPPGEYENTFVNARGERRVVYWRTAPYRDETGTVTAIVSGGVDITMRRRRELELERERDVQTTVFDSMPGVLVVLARDGTIRDRDAKDPRVGANRAFREAIAWPDEHLVGRPFLDLVIEDDDGRAARAIAAAAAGSASDKLESELACGDGRNRAFAWAAVPVSDVTGRMEGLVLVCGMEITERRRLEAEKEREREFLNAIANNAPSLLCLIDDKGVLTERGANIAFERTLEYEPAEIGGQVFWEAFVDPPEADEVRETIIGRIAAGEAPAEHDNTWLDEDRSAAARWRGHARRSRSWTSGRSSSSPGSTSPSASAATRSCTRRGRDSCVPRRRRDARSSETCTTARSSGSSRCPSRSDSLESRMESDRDAALELLTGRTGGARTGPRGAPRARARYSPGRAHGPRAPAGARDPRRSLTRSRRSRRLPTSDSSTDVEAAAYYVVAESLTNVAKYARATRRRSSVRERRACWWSPSPTTGWAERIPRRDPGSAASRIACGARRDARDREPARARERPIRAEIPLVGVRREIHSRHEQPAHRHRHFPLRRRRGLDCAAAGSGRRLRRGGRRSSAAFCATPSRPTAARRRTRWGTSTSPRSRTPVPPPTPLSRPNVRCETPHGRAA